MSPSALVFLPTTMSMRKIFVSFLWTIVIKDGLCSCPSGWRSHRNHCYLVVDSDGTRDWQQHRDYCLAQGADLVSIHSAEENEFIRTIVQDAGANASFMWTGLNDKLSERGASREGWLYTDGTPYNYQNWEPDQPNGADCVTITIAVGHWPDTTCTKTHHGAVCKKDNSYGQLYEARHGVCVSTTGNEHADVLWEGEHMKMLRCAVQCQQTQHCQGFNYYKSTGKCALLNVNEVYTGVITANGTGDCTHYLPVTTP